MSIGPQIIAVYAVNLDSCHRGGPAPFWNMNGFGPGFLNLENIE
jgi:hypothetical protein